MKRASIVLGLGFGDEGKGITTDFLCDNANTMRNTIVVRFSGGHQAGHTVMIDGLKHIHSSFPSGTLRGIPGFISHHCVISPTHMWNELQTLKDLNVEPKLFVHPSAIVCTPFDIMVNKSSKRALTDGTCGMGVGVTMDRHLNTQYKLYAVDTLNSELLKHKLEIIHDYYHLNLSKKELNGIINKFVLDCTNLPIQLLSYKGLGSRYDDFIFEGSQGIMLDMDHGTIPNVTYANTTCKNAISICNKLGISETYISTYYVTRAYLTRHGNGWMPEDNSKSKLVISNNEEEINTFNKFQGEFRIQPLNHKLLTQGILNNLLYDKSYKSHLVITCVDQVTDYKLDLSLLPIKMDEVYESSSPYSKDIKRKTNLFKHE